MLDEKALRLAEKFCIDEYQDYIIYSYLRDREGDPKLREILDKLARDERSHYEFWKRVSGRDCAESVSKFKLKAIHIMRRMMGLTFTLKWLERHEEEVIESYKEFLNRLEGEERRELERIIREEEEHENELLGSIDERLVKYMGFIALGLADAIVEVTGVHAGVLGVTSSTIYAGVTGLIVGFSAAISMASAAYIQAKHEVGRNPLFSAAITGLSYLVAVVMLALPYFLLHTMIGAFAASVVAGVILVAFFTYYSAIVSDREFLREFVETTGLMLATAFGSYLFGEALGQYFGIRVGEV